MWRDFSNERETYTDSTFRLTSSPLVKILVGPEEKEYELPRDLLSFYSPFFKACFTGEFKESKEQILRLPEDKTHVFEHFIEYLRNGSTIYEPGVTESDHRKKVIWIFALLRFADKYLIDGLCYHAMEHLKTYLYPDFEKPGYGIAFVCSNTKVEDVDFCVGLLRDGDPFFKLLAICCLRALPLEAATHQKQAVVRSLIHRNARLAGKMMMLLTEDSSCRRGGEWQLRFGLSKA